jgi:hypothetical protein
MYLLIWRIVETWRRPLEMQRPTTQQNPAEEKLLPVSQALSPQVGKHYAEIIADKDLFASSRSRAVKNVAPVVSVPPPSHLKLVGVVLTHARTEALFADATQGGKVVRVGEGEALGAYKLVSVTPSQVTLTTSQNGNEVSLPLLVADSAGAVQAQRLMPAVLRTSQGRPAQQQTAALPAANGVQPNESQAVRQNIQQLQQRLRQLRKQQAQDDTTDDSSDEEDPGAEE